jgi:hypothetical protein
VFGRWVLGVGWHGPGIGRWVLWGDDDEVSGRDTLQGPSRRRSEAPLKSASRSVVVYFSYFLGVGWCLGVGLGVGWHGPGIGRWVL